MKIKLRITALCFICLLSGGLKAQDGEFSDVEILQHRTDVLESAVKTLQKLKVSGYIQTQYQYAEAVADGINFKLANRANAYESNSYYPGSTDYKGFDSFNRFGIRRGRIKFTYEEGIVSGVAQIDITDKGIGDGALSEQGRNVVMFKDLYLNVKDPWFGTSALRAGIFDRPFGYEIAYSSSRRESPERARIFQTLFPDERDLGAMLILQPAKTSKWNFLKLEAGLFAGNGIKPQIDSHMDFIGHLSAVKIFDNTMSLSGGVSLYMGGVLQQDSSIYVMSDNRFILESKSRNNIGKSAKRQYIGFDAQFSMMTETAGLTQLRGEYIFGEHPGTASGSYNFKLTGIQNNPVYMRKVSGGYVMLVQDLGKTPFSAVVKYDWYNPNTGVSGDDIASDDVIKNSTDKKTNAVGTTGDIAMSNIGLGLLWRINPALKATAYYDIVSNETTKNSKNGTVSDTDNRITKYGWEGNRPDNVFTLRLQYAF